jgi:hypothetical protein
MTKRAKSAESPNTRLFGDSVSLEQFEPLIQRAENGEVSAARQLLEILALAVRARAPLTGQLAAYLGSRLLKIANGSDPHETLGLKLQRGRKLSSSATDTRNATLALHVAMTKRTLSKSGKRCSDERAIALVAKDHNASESTVKKAWQAFGKLVVLDDNAPHGSEVDGVLIAPARRKKAT